MYKILITGSKGFIGEHIFNEFKSNNIVRGFDIKNGEDITDKNLLERVFIEFNPDVVIHLAAIPGIRYSVNHPEEVYNINVKGFENILEMCGKYKVKHLIYASSSSVYWPYNPYAISKKMNELQADMYSGIYNIKITGLRFFTVYGKNIRKDLVISKIIDCIKEDKEFTVFGDGEQRRDFTYVGDVCKAVKCVLESDVNYHHKVFDVGTGNNISLNELIILLKNLYNSKWNKIKYIERNEFEAPYTKADTSMFYDYFDYKPETEIYEGIKCLNQ